jgi:cytochrome c oxidase cbb3-type subunit 4
MEELRVIQGYAYFFSITVLAIGLYVYIWYLYTGKKKRGVDYEKFSNLALNDALDDEIIESVDSKKTENKIK